MHFVEAIKSRCESNCGTKGRHWAFPLTSQWWIHEFRMSGFINMLARFYEQLYAPVNIILLGISTLYMRLFVAAKRYKVNLVALWIMSVRLSKLYIHIANQKLLKIKKQMLYSIKYRSNCYGDQRLQTNNKYILQSKYTYFFFQNG